MKKQNKLSIFTLRRKPLQIIKPDTDVHGEWCWMAVVHENTPQLTEKWNLPKTHANLAAGFGILESLLQPENSAGPRKQEIRCGSQLW